MKITIDGKEYWQPECNCKNNMHICYLRPMPQTINVPMHKIKLNAGGSLIAPKPHHHKEG